MEEPPPGKNINEVQVDKYIIKRIELGKQTHEGTMEDVQSAFDDLMTRYDESRKISLRHKWNNSPLC